MPILPHDFLISTAARERWARWKHDLDLSNTHGQNQLNSSISPGVSSTPPWASIDVDSQVPAVLVGPPSPRASPRPTLDPRLNRVSSTGAETIVRMPASKHSSSGILGHGRYFCLSSSINASMFLVLTTAYRD